MAKSFLVKESQKFANLVQKKCKELGVSHKDIAETVGIKAERMKSLECGKAVFERSEIQLLCLFLGIGVDELSPCEIDDSDVPSKFKELEELGVGVIAGLHGCAEVTESDELKFKRAVIQLNHCATYLSKFPN